MFFMMRLHAMLTADFDNGKQQSYSFRIFVCKDSDFFFNNEAFSVKSSISVQFLFNNVR